MKPSEWLYEYVDSHGIYSSPGLARSLQEHCGIEPAPWPVHSTEETRRAIKARSLGGHVKDGPPGGTAWGWEIAEALAVKLLPGGYQRAYYGRGTRFRSAFIALREAGF